MFTYHVRHVAPREKTPNPPPRNTTHHIYYCHCVLFILINVLPKLPGALGIETCRRIRRLPRRRHRSAPGCCRFQRRWRAASPGDGAPVLCGFSAAERRHTVDNSRRTCHLYSCFISCCFDSLCLNPDFLTFWVALMICCSGS